MEPEMIVDVELSTLGLCCIFVCTKIMGMPMQSCSYHWQLGAGVMYMANAVKRSVGGLLAVWMAGMLVLGRPWRVGCVNAAAAAAVLATAIDAAAMPAPAVYGHLLGRPLRVEQCAVGE